MPLTQEYRRFLGEKLDSFSVELNKIASTVTNRAARDEIQDIATGTYARLAMSYSSTRKSRANKGGADNMPSKPPKPCCAPGCPTLTHSRYCPQHASQARRIEDSRRGSAASRGYGSKWTRWSAAHRRRFPVCQLCALEGRTTPSDLSHHLHPVSQGGAVFVPDDQLLAVCRDCHPRVEPLGERWREAADPPRGIGVKIAPNGDLPKPTPPRTAFGAIFGPHRGQAGDRGNHPSPANGGLTQ
jgi:5-methylcytosine-specific restriction protein A